MKQISSIQLYRYNIGSEGSFHTEYMAMDYFDAFQVKEEKDVIHGCIGNQEMSEKNYLALQNCALWVRKVLKVPIMKNVFNINTGFHTSGFWEKH